MDRGDEHVILLVDDEPDILDVLERALVLEGYTRIVRADTGRSAVTACQDCHPDVIVLDVMLPDIDGYEVCKQIREFSHCPILFLSAKDDELDKILGLAVGGDDYVAKPFSPKELAYRVKAQLRRAEYTHDAADEASIDIGTLTIDIAGCRVTKGQNEVNVTAREFQILLYLARNKGRVISRERLYETVWGENGFGCDNTVMVHIRHIREKIEDNPTDPRYIVTVKSLGYKLVDPCEER